MKTLKKLTFAVLLACFALTVNAQRPDRSENTKREREQRVDMNELHQKMLVKKHDFFQKELELEGEQMDKFWEIYTEFDNRIFRLHEKAHEEQIQITGMEFDEKTPLDENKLTDEMANALLDQRRQMEAEKLEMETFYTDRFRTVLPVQKVLRLHRLEKQFMRDVMSDGRHHLDRRQAPQREKR
ncbi:MAG: hypothetical protein IJ250_08285 [Bacteroidales bacterium]|nr:hypothetical protein [Bacteroidales bacterium]